MAEQIAATGGSAPTTRLEPDAINVAQDTLVGLTPTGPSVSAGFALATLAAAASCGSPTQGVASGAQVGPGYLAQMIMHATHELAGRRGAR